MMRAIGQVAGVQAGETQIHRSVIVDVTHYEIEIASCLEAKDKHHVTIGYDDRGRKLAVIRVNLLHESQPYPELSGDHQSDWDSLWQMINAARQDGIEILVLRRKQR